MAILKIAKMGDPVLRATAQEVVDPTAPQIHALIRDMVETMVDAGGAGLAAPQVHVPLRIVIFHQPPDEDDADGMDDGAEDGGAEEDAGAAAEVAPRGPLSILINPVIEPLGDDMEADWEGCLSVPGMRGVVSRYGAIRYTGLGPDGATIEREARGFHARVVQHECDHLDGVLYPQLMSDLRLLGFNDELDNHPLQFAPQDDADADAEA
jgi:peptide deformylase